jgi:hypothetical protein
VTLVFFEGCMVDCSTGQVASLSLTPCRSLVTVVLEVWEYGGGPFAPPGLQPERVYISLGLYWGVSPWSFRVFGARSVLCTVVVVQPN